jgi:hypothetical protein
MHNVENTDQYDRIEVERRKSKHDGDQIEVERRKYKHELEMDGSIYLALSQIV